MAIVIKLDTPEELREYFRRYDRDNFTLDGYQALIDYFDDLPDYELDVIAICCDFCEASWEDIKEDYNNHDDIAVANNIDELVEALNNYTMAIRTSGDNILYAHF